MLATKRTPSPARVVFLCACVCAGVAMLALPARAHPGQLAGDGCHNNRRAGTCHCHRADASRDGCTRGAVRAQSAERERDANQYRRADWHPRWEDADGDCQNTRHEVLIAESRTPPTLTADGCAVLAGEWLDPYTGRVERDPRALDIDHRVPLAEAHRSGGAQWSRRKKRAFANDLRAPETLVATSRRANRSKGARDPARWMPPNASAHCAYLRDWVRVKRRWQLAMDDAEARAVAAGSARCGGLLDASAVTVAPVTQEQPALVGARR